MSNVFKKFYETLSERLHFDVKFRDHGVSLNVDLKPNEKEADKRAFAIAINGLYNPIGGVLVTFLEGPNDERETFTIPEIVNKANLFLFLNGKLIPDEIPDRCTLGEYILGDDLIDDICDEGLNDSTCPNVELNEGYKLGYVYILPRAIREYMDNPDKMSLSEFLSSSANILTAEFGNNDVYVTVDASSDETESEWLLEQRRMATLVMDSLCGNYPDKKNYHCLEHTVPLVDALSEYVYSNILREMEKEIKKLTKSNDTRDIPWTNESLQQTKWLAKIKKSVKDEAVWKKIQSDFLVDWK